MSVNKLLSRIVAPDIDYKTQSTVQAVASTLHDYTYGITSDPLTQFSCVFSALIHDAGRKYNIFFSSRIVQFNLNTSSHCSCFLF